MSTRFEKRQAPQEIVGAFFALSTGFTRAPKFPRILGDF